MLNSCLNILCTYSLRDLFLNQLPKIYVLETLPEIQLETKLDQEEKAKMEGDMDLLRKCQQAQ